MAAPSPDALGRVLQNSKIQVGEQSRKDDVLLSGVDCYFHLFYFYPVRKLKFKHFQTWLYF